MFSPTYLCICIYCMLQLGFIIYAENCRRNIQVRKNRYFLWMLIITLFSYVADIMSSLQTDSDWLFTFIAAGNYIEIILNTSLLPIFFRYTCDQIMKLDKILKRRINSIILIMASVCAGLVVSTAFSGQIFYYDEARVYHRGQLFALPMIILFIMMLIIEVFIISQKKKIEPHYYRSLVLFIIAPLIGWALQFFIYGLPFSLLGLTFASLILHINNKNRDIDKDYLTDVYNRQTLDSYMQRKIETSTKTKTFSAILLDIDNFKSINDLFGHSEGDTALINTVQILRDSLYFTDFIARYGGDEFCVVLDSDNPEIIKDTILRINNTLLEFNNHEDKSYKLSFSIGYEIYQPSIGKKSVLFLNVVDKKMYEQKNAKRYKQSP